MESGTSDSDAYDQFEVFLIYLVAGLGILLRNVIYQSLLKRDISFKCAIFTLDSVCMILPMMLAQTLYADRLYELIGTMLAGIIAVVIMDIAAILFGLQSNKDRRIFREIDSKLAVRCSITWLRAMVFISTSIAILAVDFDVFPRRFVKTLRFGHSLMDTGTAAYVFVSALSDYRAATERNKKRSPFITLFGIRLPSFLLLLVMGVGRSVFVLASGYQHTIDEYGVHWNFFVTLFCLRVMLYQFWAFVEMVPYPYSMYAALLVGSVYELTLTRGGVADFVLRDAKFPRQGFLDQNREGVFSLFGYIFLYGLALLYARISTSALYWSRKLSLRRIFSHGIAFVFVFLTLQKGAEQVNGLSASRRLANMPYTFAMAALFAIAASGLQLFAYAIGSPSIEWNADRYGVPQAVSRNGLMHFLLANFTTGLINIFVLRRYRFETTAEMACLVSYIFFLTLATVAINLRRR